MIFRISLTRRVRAFLVALSFVFFTAATWAARVTLAWTPSNSPLVAGYEVEYGTASGEYTMSVDAGTNLSQIIPALTPGTTYYLAVFAYSETNQGPVSDEVVYAVPAVVETSGPPQITSEPVSQTVGSGSAVVFSVGVTGSTPLNFQWFYNALPLFGETNSSLTVADVSDASAGNYSALVINNAGTALSTVATLAVVDPPVIIAQPVSQTVVAGQTAAMTVVADGTMPLSYQWFDNGAPLAGATNANLTLANASDTNDGNYDVVIDNSEGSVTSSAVTLSIIDPPVITSQPVSQNAALGSSVTFRAGVYGTAPFTFQWYHFGAPVPQAQLRALTLSPVVAADAGGYYLTVQNAAGSARTDRAVLTVTNIFSLSSGIYNGLFYETNGNQLPEMDAASTGLLGNCVVGQDGTYSASIYLGGVTYPLTGTFGTTGADSETVSRAAGGLSNLVVALNLDLTGASQSITGSISNTDPADAWNSPLTALLATNELAVPPGAWYVTIPPLDGSVLTAPQGFAILSMSSTGVATLLGQLYDGTTISQSVPVAGNGSLPLYFSLYRGQGLIAGWISLTGGLPTGTVTWIRPTDAISPILESGGFTNVVNIY